MGAKGKPKDPGSGRKLGTPNKRTIHFDLHAECQAKGVNVWEKLIEYLMYPADENIRLQAIRIALPYLYPQKKSIEHSGEINNPYLEMTIEDLEKEVKAKLKEKK